MNSAQKTLNLYKIKPKKKLGQSFLEDRNIIDGIVELAGLRSNETVVEIGAGLGMMTERIAGRVERLIALEVDRGLVNVLRERFAERKNVDILQADVLTYDFSLAFPNERVKIIGNIPYYISSPILFHLLKHRKTISAMILMFQKELADRITASAGEKNYGIPSVMVSKYTNVTYEMTVSPACFYPSPEVVSSVLRFEMKSDERFEDELLFEKIVRSAFAKRRKILWNNLRNIGLPEESVCKVFEESGIDRGMRAEMLTCGDFIRLTKRWREILQRQFS